MTAEAGHCPPAGRAYFPERTGRKRIRDVLWRLHITICIWISGSSSCSAGLPDPTLEARELVCCASGKSREELSRDGRLYVPDTVEQQVRRLVQRHLDG